MRYIQLKNKIKNLESSVKTSIYNCKKGRSSCLSCRMTLSNAWLDCYMDLQQFRNRFILDEDRDPLYIKLREIRKFISLMR